MAGDGSLFDYIVIVLLSGGIVMLGMHELSHSKEYQAYVDGGSAGSQTGFVLDSMREDFSSELAEGGSAEQLTADGESEVKARFPWTLGAGGVFWGNSRVEEAEEGE